MNECLSDKEEFNPTPLKQELYMYAGPTGYTYTYNL